MKSLIKLATALMASGTIAFAQVCPSTPGSVCLVPPPSYVNGQQQATTCAPIVASTNAITVPYTACPMTTACPTTSALPLTTAQTCPSTSYLMPTTLSAQACPMTGISTQMYPVAVLSAQACPMPNYSTQPLSISVLPAQACPTTNLFTSSCPTTSMSSETAACYGVANQVSALRGDVRSLQGTIRAASLTIRGQDLVNRMNQLMANETLFRQELSANPNLPGAQAMAIRLTQQAEDLNRDLASFNRELSMIPVEQRPFIANDLNAFSVAYWDPTMQRFSAYTTQFAQMTPTYQTASAANPWLQNWQTSYQSALNAINAAPQTYASNAWWSNTRVLGSVEMYPTTTTTGTGMMPQGTIIYIPAGSNVGTVMGNM
ncbi:MAG TPA: hypothetical protein VHV83_06020 [Armatimonadota bacterium]|nr:hypothetical protein [Armatimonadota bacterium]